MCFFAANDEDMTEPVLYDVKAEQKFVKERINAEIRVSGGSKTEVVSEAEAVLDDKAAKKAEKEKKRAEKRAAREKEKADKRAHSGYSDCPKDTRTMRTASQQLGIRHLIALVADPALPFRYKNDIKSLTIQLSPAEP